MNLNKWFMPYTIYYNGPRWGGINAWHLKALWKVGSAGKRGKEVKLSYGRVTKLLVSMHFITRTEKGSYMLTSLGQYHFKELKRKKT
ncbi:hypothetical protein [Rufibacter soli]